MEESTLVVKPKIGLKVHIPDYVFSLESGKKQGNAKILDIEGSDVVLQFESGEQGICQIYEIPLLHLWCGKVLEKEHIEK